MRIFTLTLTLAAAGLAAAQEWDRRQWDVIVVGAGPAGIIVADRMSEAGKQTLLLEQGGPSYGITGGRQRPAWLDSTDLSRVDVPGLYKSIFADQGNLTCQNWTASFTGCTIGGSSAINAGLFFQPPASDFDSYFPNGWKSADVNASIGRVYTRVPSSDVYSSDKKFYLQSGYDAARKWIVDGAGYKNVDLNSAADDKTKVFGRPIFDYNNGQRGGPATTYLQTALNRSNFHLQTGVRVIRVVRNGQEATGVDFQNVVNNSMLNGGGTINLARNGRVILSGGGLQSPQLLMYSGIGDPTLSTNLSASSTKILNATTWINNTAVGDGLFDNPNTFIELSGPSISSYTYNYSNPIQSDAELYVKDRSGPYSFASETSAFWSYIKRSDGSMAGMQGTIDSAGFGDYMSNNTITLNVYGTSGLKSKGKVVLNQDYLPGATSDVYYSDPQDVADIANFIHSIFQGLNASDLTPLNIAANSTVDQIRDYINSTTDYTRGEVQHWSSSCRIGSCVDTNTTVIGTKNIHVVDASILMPLTVNPQFGVMIAAERASELILAMNNTFANPANEMLLGLNSTSGAITNSSGTTGGSGGSSGSSGGHKNSGMSIGSTSDVRTVIALVMAFMAINPI